MSIYAFEALSTTDEIISLSDYEGKVLLIVNTASQCGFTPQYKELQELYEKYNGHGFEVLAFPCDQFMNQEPGTNEEIQEFCTVQYGVSFPIFAKIKVNGPDAHPLFHYLSKEVKGILGSTQIKWNFTKFLINRSGEVIERYAPQTNPLQLEDQVKSLLSE